MRRVFSLAAILLLAAPLWADNSVLTGTFQIPTGSRFNGSITLQLSHLATDAGVAVAPAPVTFRIRNGVFVGQAVVKDNDTLSPTGTYYKAVFRNRFGSIIARSNYVVIGTPFDMGAAPMTQITTSQVGYINPVNDDDIPDCDDSVNDKLIYDNEASPKWSCVADQGAGGGGGINSLNTLVATDQTMVVGTAGTNFAITSAGSVHTFDLPDAGATARGLVTSSNQTFGGTKTAPIWNASTGFQVGGLGTAGRHLRGDGTNLVLSATAAAGVGVCAASQWADVLNDDAVPTCTQPGFSDLSGAATDAQVPNTITLDNITQITNRNFSDMQGSVSLGQLPFGAANQVLGTNAAGTIQEHKTLSVGVSGTDFNIIHSAGGITFNLPNASPSNRGVVSTVTQSFVGQKTFTGNLIAALAFQVTNNEADLQAGLKVTGVAKLPSIQSTNVIGDLALAIVAGNGIDTNEAGGLITLQTGAGNGTGAGGNLLIQPGDHGGSGSVPGIVDFNLPADSGLSIRQSGAASPSTVGLIRIPWNRFIYSRNSTNTANIQILGIDTASGTNEVWVGDQALGVGMRTESIIAVSDITAGDDIFIGGPSDGWVFNNVSLPGSLVLIEMPPSSASGGEMSLLGQGIGQTEIDANSVGASELDDGECVDGQIWKRATGSWDCGTDDTGAAGLGYSLQGMGDLLSPADATTYFFGSLMRLPETTAALNRIYIPKAGNIVRFRVFVRVVGTLGSAHLTNHFIRLNDTTDSLQIDLAYNATANTGVATGSVAVVAGDFIEVKFNTPTWTVNPTSVFWSAVVFIE